MSMIYLRITLLLLLFGVSAASYGQKSQSIFLSDDGKAGFYAMVPNNARGHKQHKVYAKTEILRGPKSKRSRRVARSSKKSIASLPVQVRASSRMFVKGPKRKNWKPWKG